MLLNNMWTVKIEKQKNSITLALKIILYENLGGHLTFHKTCVLGIHFSDKAL